MLVRIPATRWVLNSVLRSRGCVASNWFPRFFDGPGQRGSFIWRCRFQNHDILLPVVPAFPQSWLIAYSMHRHEPNLVRFWDTYLKLYPKPVFFDVGANHGLHSYRLLASGSQCYAFEPQATCVQFLRTVALLNGWDLPIQQCVLGSTEGSAILYRSEETFTSSTVPGWVTRWDTLKGEETVSQTTLDAICESIQQYPDLIKIDVEGAEASVIAGGLKCLQASKPTIVVEAQQETGGRGFLWQTLVPLGYKVLEISGQRALPIESQETFAARKDWDFVFTTDERLIDATLRR